MIVTVGIGDSQAIAFSIRKQNPSTILFIVTDESKQISLDQIKLYLDINEYTFIVKECKDINDFETLAMQYSKYIKELIDSGFKETQIVADFSSGTKPMSTALVYASIERGIETISYVYTQSYDKNSESKGPERLNTLSPIAIYTDRKIDSAIRFFNKHMYFTALEIIRDSDLKHPFFMEKISLIEKIIETYSEWDKFNFGNAFTLLNEVAKHKELETLVSKEIIEKHKTILYFLLNPKDSNKSKETKEDKNKPNENLISDLLANAQRRYIEGKFDDAIARLYRCLEMIGQVELYKHFQFTTSNIELDKLTDVIKNEFIQKYGRIHKIKIGLHDTFKVLKSVDNFYASIYYQNESEILKLLSIRNDSILAHGTKPVEKEKFEDFLKLFIEKFQIKIVVEFPKIHFTLL